MTQETKREKKQPHYAGVGLVLGSAVGFTLGAGNPVTAAMGAAIGLILGAGLDTRQQKSD